MVSTGPTTRGVEFGGAESGGADSPGRADATGVSRTEIEVASIAGTDDTSPENQTSEAGAGHATAAGHPSLAAPHVVRWQGGAVWAGSFCPLCPLTTYDVFWMAKWDAFYYP